MKINFEMKIKKDDKGVVVGFTLNPSLYFKDIFFIRNLSSKVEKGLAKISIVRKSIVIECENEIASFRVDDDDIKAIQSYIDSEATKIEAKFIDQVGKILLISFVNEKVYKALQTSIITQKS